MFGYLVGGAVLVFLLFLTYGAVTGRVRLRDRGCCTTDPEKDLRMRNM